MDEAEKELPPLKVFILPGGVPSASELHVCRTICRRCERSVVALEEETKEIQLTIQYLNRLSDLLFVLARLENHRAGAKDVSWQKEP